MIGLNPLMARIRLFSKKHGIKYAFIDDGDFASVSQIKNWHISKERNNFYAVATVNGKSIRMHRLIMRPRNDQMVDHKDHNGLNNRRRNLRLCTNAENIRNQRLHKRSSTGYRGVTFHIHRNTFNSAITVDRKTIHLGCFRDARTAAIVYNDAASKYHKEFAVLNKI